MTMPDPLTKHTPQWVFLLTVITLAFSMVFITGAAFNRLEHLEEETNEIKGIQRDVQELKTDVRWIRERLDK